MVKRAIILISCLLFALLVAGCGGGKKEEETKKNIVDDSIIYRNFENQMKDILGTKVEIKKKAKNKGRIEIEYYSMEELERLIELMNRLK